MAFLEARQLLVESEPPVSAVSLTIQCFCWDNHYDVLIVKLHVNNILGSDMLVFIFCKDKLWSRAFWSGIWSLLYLSKKVWAASMF